jgi:hypothetical protein
MVLLLIIKLQLHVLLLLPQLLVLLPGIVLLLPLLMLMEEPQEVNMKLGYKLV